MFPLPSNHFPAVRLAPAQVVAYEAMLHAQLQDALRVYAASYAHGLGAAGGEKLEAPWKCVGSLGRLSTYKLAGSERAGELGSFLQSFRTFGKVQGYYRDILNVHHAETTPELRNLQQILYPDTLDAAVLHTIRSSTSPVSPPAPLHPAGSSASSSASPVLVRHAPQSRVHVTQEQYFGIKWIASSSPSSEIRTRDCCFVELLGYTTDAFGREIGFSVAASIALPECPDMLETKRVTRFRMRHTMLVVPTPDAQATTTEVFVTGVREVVDASLGTNAHHRHLMAILNDMSLVIDSRNITKQALVPRSEWVPDHARRACSVCARRFHCLFRRKHHCRLCGDVICRTCYVKRSVPSAIASSSAAASAGGGGASSSASAIAQDKFCVRCVMELRAGDRCIADFSQQIHKGTTVSKDAIAMDRLLPASHTCRYACVSMLVNSLRVQGRDSSISSDVGVSGYLSAYNSGSSYQLSSLSSCSEKSSSVSTRRSSVAVAAAAAASSSSRGSAITYYTRASQQKKVVRLEDLIKFPVEPPPPDASPTDDTDDDDDDDGLDTVVSHAPTKRAMPTSRLQSTDASMLELYDRLLRLSQSSDSAKMSSSSRRCPGSRTANATIAELRQSIASQETLLSQLRQSLVVVVPRA